MNDTAVSFSPWLPLLGGAILGLGAGVLLLFAGRVAGISGILAGAFSEAGDRAWRIAFLAGLVLGGVALVQLAPSTMSLPRVSTAVLVLAGLLVGGGAQLSGGCTSGHGVCGLPRLSPRSLVAVLTFMSTGAVTVFLMRVLGGGA